MHTAFTPSSQDGPRGLDLPLEQAARGGHPKPDVQVALARFHVLLEETVSHLPPSGPKARRLEFRQKNEVGLPSTVDGQRQRWALTGQTLIWKERKPEGPDQHEAVPVRLDEVQVPPGEAAGLVQQRRVQRTLRIEDFEHGLCSVAAADPAQSVQRPQCGGG